MTTHEVIPEARLAVEGLTKTYPGTVALRDFHISFRPGEIHSLVGTNGSGKSTLIKILAGVVRGDPGGSVTLDGQTFESDSLSPAWAAANGLNFVHQQPTVFADLSIAENLALARRGFEKNAARLISWRKTQKHAVDVLRRFNIKVDPSRQLGALRPAQQMMIAIAGALQDQDGSGRGLLVLDEPTAALPKAEVSQLLDELRELAAAGQTILYVSHRLDEVLAVSDRVTVVRDGIHRATTTVSDLTHDGLVELMIGQPIAAATTAERKPGGEVLLDVQGLARGPLREVTFDVRAGEVVGIAGLLGSGRSTLLRTIFGCARPESGSMTMVGRPYKPKSPRHAMDASVALVPEDRAADAGFLDQSVADNLNIGDLRRNFRRVAIVPHSERTTAKSLIQGFGVRTASEASLLSALSGGNQQKVIMARWLARSPKLLLLDEPSQGVDARARLDIHHLIREAVSAGAGALVASSDSEELAQHCDRVLVLAHGRITAEIRGDSLTAHGIDQTVLGFQASEVAR